MISCNEMLSIHNFLLHHINTKKPKKNPCFLLYASWPSLLHFQSTFTTPKLLFIRLFYSSPNNLAIPCSSLWKPIIKKRKLITKMSMTIHCSHFKYKSNQPKFQILNRRREGRKTFLLSKFKFLLGFYSRQNNTANLNFHQNGHVFSTA